MGLKETLKKRACEESGGFVGVTDSHLGTQEPDRQLVVVVVDKVLWHGKRVVEEGHVQSSAVRLSCSRINPGVDMVR